MFDVAKVLEEFDDRIIERGERYYHEGRVVDLQELFSGEYQATVRGSEDYTVSVTLGPNSQYAFDCDCPYWNAPFCKHVVAVLLALQARSIQTEPAPEKASQPKEAPMDALLSGLSKEKLVSLLLEITSAFPPSQSWLQARISPPEDEIASYRHTIRQIAGVYLHDHFIRYRDMGYALRGAEEALARLEEKLLSSDDVLQTLDFALMLAEETLSIMNSGDDSDGGAGEIIFSCLDTLEQHLLQRVLQEDADIQQKYYQRLMAVIQSPLFRGWDSWNRQLMEQCIRIADQLPSLREELLRYQLKKMEPMEDAEDYIGQFEQQQAQEAYFTLLSRWGEEDAAHAFAAKHMEHDSFRIYFYEDYLRQKESDKAIDLCLQAEKACVSCPGLYRQWQKRRYAVYALSNRQDEQRQLAEALLMEGEGEFYPLLKGLYSPDAWPLKRAELLDQLYQRHQHTYLETILAEDDRLRLIAYVRLHPTAVFHFYDRLLPDYANEIQNLFLSAMKILASQATDRKAYQNVCRHVRIVGKVCGKSSAIALIHELQQAYPRKPAFQDELQKLRKHYRAERTDQSQPRTK